MSALATDEGRRRYPPDGVYVSSLDDSETVCTCAETCDDPCEGECGCEACGSAASDYYY